MEVLKARADITSLIETVSKENGINNYVITNVQTNQKGEGYLGQIFLVSVKDAKGEKRLEVVIKAAFTDEKVREMVPIRMSFQNEIYFYTDVLSSFWKFAKERGSRSRVRFVPECLKVSLKNREEVLVLENMRASGFEIFDKKDVLDEDHVRLIFKTYGRFHGYSFLLRHQNPEEFEKVAEGCYNVFEEFAKNDVFAKHIVDMGEMAKGTLSPGEDDEIIAKFEKYSGNNMMNIFKDILTEDVDYSALLHGDCWSNNMMFKYEKHGNGGKKPTDMRLIDFQLISVGSPVCDLSYCLYSGASKKIFDNLNEHLRVYYDSFSSLVKELGGDPEKLFPFSVLKEHWKKYSRFGMIMALTVIKMKLNNIEDIVDLTDGLEMDQFAEILAKQRFDEEGYRKRIRGLLSHMSEIGAL